MPAASVSAGAGCFGKLPGRGDFLRRDLDGVLVERLDAWLAEALSVSREALGRDWQELYLTAPVWRFLLGAGRRTGWRRPASCARARTASGAAIRWWCWPP